MQVEYHNLNEDEHDLNSGVEVNHLDLQLDLTDLEEIPDVPIKALPEQWEQLSNIVPRVIPMLKTYNSILQNQGNISKLPPVVINTGCAFPRWSQPNATTEAKRSIIKQQCKSWLEAGIIEKSLSPWASTVVVVSQKISHRRSEA